MVRWGPLLVAFTGCSQHWDHLVIDYGDIVVGPWLTDVGTVLPGDVVPFSIGVFHDQGASVRVWKVIVTGDPEFASTETGPFTVTGAESHELPLTYAPAAPGEHSATVAVYNDGRVEYIEVYLRGRAAWPELDAFPAAVDFGTVAIGETAERTVTVRDEGALHLDEIPVSAGVVAVAASLPQGDTELVLTWTPTDDAPMHDTVFLDVPNGPIAIAVFGNDPATAAWTDADGDGFAVEAGDCHDDDPALNPAAIDLVDGVDDDCDGDVDENADVDRDGFTEADGDCDDHNPWASPAADEWCDGVDNDCNGVEDDDCGYDGHWTAPDRGCDHAPTPPALMALVALAAIVRRGRAQRGTGDPEPRCPRPASPSPSATPTPATAPP